MKCATLVLTVLVLVGCSLAKRGGSDTSGEIVVPAHIFTITDFGANGDGATSNTEAIAKAIDAAKKAGGGTIIIPPGVYLTGPIELFSNMSLVIEKGAMLKASDDFADYGPEQLDSDDKLADEFRGLLKPIIGATGAANIEIRGEGTIDGQGKKWWQRTVAEKKAGAPGAGDLRKTPVKQSSRPRLILLTDCRRVRIAGISINNAPNFNIALYRCESVIVEHATITAPQHSPNTDGIDPCNCKNVVIRNCTIDVGDDNISFKSARNAPPLENVHVYDCTFKHGHGASVGSSLGSGIRNIVVERCTFEGTTPAIRIKSARDRGAVVENIVYRDIQMKDVSVAITMNMYYFDTKAQLAREMKPVTSTTPIIRDVVIENITATGAKVAGEILGLPEMPISNVLLKNVKIDSLKGFTIRDAQDVKLDRVTIQPKEGEPMTVEHAEVK